MTDFSRSVACILLPSHNRAHNIRSLNSLLVQSGRQRYCFLVVADPAAPDAGEAVADYLRGLEKTDRISSFRTVNSIPECVRLIKSEFLMVLRPPDFLLAPDAVQTGIAFLDQNAHCQMCRSQVYRIDSLSLRPEAAESRQPGACADEMPCCASPFLFRSIVLAFLNGNELADLANKSLERANFIDRFSLASIKRQLVAHYL